MVDENFHKEKKARHNSSYDKLENIKRLSF
jgi:hypothetical protein